MIRRPPRSTRTDTLFPYTTLCRSREVFAAGEHRRQLVDRHRYIGERGPATRLDDTALAASEENGVAGIEHLLATTLSNMQRRIGGHDKNHVRHVIGNEPRSEERRVGQECGSTCSYRWSPSN